MKKSKIVLHDLVTDKGGYFVIGCLHVVCFFGMVIGILALVWVACLFTN